MKCQLCEKRAIWRTFADRWNENAVKVCQKCYHYLWTLEGPQGFNPDRDTP